MQYVNINLSSSQISKEKRPHSHPKLPNQDYPTFKWFQRSKQNSE